MTCGKSADKKPNGIYIEIQLLRFCKIKPELFRQFFQRDIVPIGGRQFEALVFFVDSGKRGEYLFPVADNGIVVGEFARSVTAGARSAVSGSRRIPADSRSRKSGKAYPQGKS